MTTHEASKATYQHEFRIRPYDPDWCIVTKDNEGHDITVADSLPEELAEWMCAVLNAGVKHDLSVLPELVEKVEAAINLMYTSIPFDDVLIHKHRPWTSGTLRKGAESLQATLNRLRREG